jgi:pilus assembly protein CpaC
VTGLGQINVQYKEFGVRLNFTPTIAGDVIRLKMRPEVSTLDFTNGIVLSGFRIPALNVRRAETDVELRDGQSFAIAGLLNNLTQTDKQGIPLLGRLPILGNLFKSRSMRAEQTELMVLVTPRLVRALDPDEVPTLPVRPGAFVNPADDEDDTVPMDDAERGTRPPLQDAPPPARGTPPPTPGAVRRPPPGR